MNIHEDQSLVVYVVNVFQVFTAILKVKIWEKIYLDVSIFITKIGRKKFKLDPSCDWFRLLRKFDKFQLPKLVLNNILLFLLQKNIAIVCLLCKSLVKWVQMKLIPKLIFLFLFENGYPSGAHIPKGLEGPQEPANKIITTWNRTKSHPLILA